MIPTTGRLVHFRIGGTDEAPKLRPALVVEDWGITEAPNTDQGAVNLVVFLDGSNDKAKDRAKVGLPEKGLTGWVTSRTRGKGIGQWREPKRV
jgi:hypothetical protein